MLHQHSQLNILLVEDSQIQIKVLEHAIKDLPIFHLMHVAEDGDVALKYLRAEKKFADRKLPDVILCDINMPRVSGFEVLEAVKADDSLRQIPFVMLTTSDDEVDVLRAYAEGASTYITKPIDLFGLEQVLAHFAHYWQAAQLMSQRDVEELVAQITAESGPDPPPVDYRLTAKSINVLLVEDSPTQAAMIRDAIQAVREFDLIAHVTDGEQAMAYLRREGSFARAKRPHLIVLDINMPKKDGFAVLDDIKRDNELRSIVVVILTVRDRPDDIVRCYNLRANTFLTKPVDVGGLRAVLHRFASYWADEAVQLPPEE